MYNDVRQTLGKFEYEYEHHPSPRLWRAGEHEYMFDMKKKKFQIILSNHEISHLYLSLSNTVPFLFLPVSVRL